MKKQKKTERVNLRFHAELMQRVEKTSYYLGISKNKLIENAIWNYVLDLGKFAVCPDCKIPIFEKQTTPITEGQSVIRCKNDHENTFDFANQEWIS